eukprot:1143734-Pelagomonas_calceolata.AAC.3
MHFPCLMHIMLHCMDPTRQQRDAVADEGRTEHAHMGPHADWMPTLDAPPKSKKPYHFSAPAHNLFSATWHDSFQQLCTCSHVATMRHCTTRVVDPL